jgi:hypothetical protein
MKNFFLVFILICLVNFTSFAQSDNLLVAKSKGRTIYFTQNEAVKISFKEADVTQEFRGRIGELSEDKITMKGFGKKGTIEIPVSNLVSIRKLNRTGKIITGIIGGLGLYAGMGLIIEDASERGEWFDGLGTALGTGTIITTTLPYILLAATPGTHTTEKGFQFYVAKRKTR